MILMKYSQRNTLPLSLHEPSLLLWKLKWLFLLQLVQINTRFCAVHDLKFPLWGCQYLQASQSVLTVLYHCLIITMAPEWHVPSFADLIKFSVISVRNQEMRTEGALDHYYSLIQSTEPVSSLF